MAQYEGRWNCKHCSRVNRGGSVDCEGCGKDRPHNVEFYLPENEPAVSDPVLLEKANRPPDRTCIHCGAISHGKCPKCGSTSSTPYETVLFPKEAFKPLQRPRNVDFEGPARYVTGLSKPSTVADYATSLRRFSGFVFVMGGVIGAALLVYFLAFGTRTAKLQSKSWTRTIAIEQLRTVRDSDWLNRLPNDARQLRTYSAIRSYIKVPVGTETRYRTQTEEIRVGTKRVKTGTRNKGNGFFEDVYADKPIYKTVYREVPYTVTRYIDSPVLDTKVDYEVDRWQPSHTETNSGTNIEPEWPILQLKRTGGVGDQREGQRAESFKAVFKDSKGEVVEKTIDASQYKTLNAQTTYKLNTAFGSVTDVQELKAEKE